MFRVLLTLLCIIMLSLSGCADTVQVEDLAFAEILGVDLNDQNQIEVCIEIPKISGQRSEGGSGSSEGNSSNLIYSASGETIDEALNLLQWAVPRRLDLSQIELIVVSEKMAGSELFRRVANTIMATPRLYTAARFAVCSGSAKEFVSAEDPVVGTRLASELTATFEDYIRNGFIPDATFADFFYRSYSFYSDSLAIHAESSPTSGSSSGQKSAAPAAAIIPDNPQQSSVEMQHSNRFLGAAVFHAGRMVGTLNGEEYLYCKILRGESQAFPFFIDGQTVGLTTIGKPSVKIGCDAQPMHITLDLHFSIVSSSRNAPMEKLQTELRKAFSASIEACRDMNAEPLNLAEHASGSFLTFDDWQKFNWIDRFSDSEIDINIRIDTSSD